MTFVCVASACPCAHAAVERFAVVVGNNYGSVGEQPLRYAEDDARKLADVLLELGQFSPENVVILQHRDAHAMRRALIAVNDRIRTSREGSQALLFVYYSGHGDSSTLHLGSTSLDLIELEQLVRGSPAAFRMLVLDACRSGALTRPKGGVVGPAQPIELDGRLSSEGAVFLTSSAAHEDAQESDRLKGSFFTHYLVSGLLGAADKNEDDQVSLEEAYHYSYDNTLRATSRTLGGLQHPSFRYDLHGRGGVILTTLNSPDRTTVLFPPGRSYLVTKDHADGAVVAEVGGNELRRRLNLRAGRYFFVGRGPDFLLDGAMTLAAGATLRLGDELLTRADYARLVRKGGGTRAHGLEAGYLLSSALPNAQGLCHGLSAGYKLALTWLTLGARASYCRAGYDNVFLRANLDSFDSSLHAAYTWDLGPITVALGVSAGGGAFRQSFETRGLAPTRISAFFWFAPSVTLTVPIPRGFFAALAAEPSSYLYAQTSDQGRVNPGPYFSLRGVVSFGKYWLE